MCKRFAFVVLTCLASLGAMTPISFAFHEEAGPTNGETFESDPFEARTLRGPGSEWSETDWSDPYAYDSILQLDANSTSGELTLLPEGEGRVTVLYVADSGNNRIVRTSMDGTGWTTLGTEGSESGQLSYPADVSADASTGTLHIADDNNNRIVRTKMDGTGWTALGTLGWGEGQFRNPRGIHHDSLSGYVYVADLHGARVVRTKMDGTGWQTLSCEVPLGIHYEAGEGYLYFSDQLPGYVGGSVARTEMDGTGWTVFNPVTAGIGELSGSSMIYYDASSCFIFIADRGNHRIVRTKMDGTGWQTFGEQGSGEGQFRMPTGICYDPFTEYVYVSDSENHRIVRTRMDGTGWAVLGSLGSGNLQFNYPFGIDLVVETPATYPAEGCLVSRPHDCRAAPLFRSLDWNATTPEGTFVRFQLRTAPSLELLASRPFLGPDGAPTSYYKDPDTSIWTGHEGDRWIQYKLYMGTTDPATSPVLHEFVLGYNCHPELSGPRVIPPTGDITTLFNFTVEYYDVDNDQPGSANITVDNTSHPLLRTSQQDTPPPERITLWFSTTLATGDHTYSFSVSDGELWCHTQEDVVHVTPGQVHRIEITPVEVSLTADEQMRFAATALDVAGNVLSVDMEWNVSGGGTIDRTGLFDATRAGTWRVWANASGVSGVATVEVMPGSLARIEVFPSTHAMTTDDTVTFTARALDADGNEVPVSPVWEVLGGGFIDQSGQFDPTTVGTWSVFATEDSIMGEARVDVSAGRLDRVELVPQEPIVTADDQLELIARGFDADGNEIEISPVWSATGGGTVDQNGLFTANVVGEWTVYADHSDLRGFSSITVEPGALSRIEVLPNSTAMNVSETISFIAKGFDADGNERNVEPTWSVGSGGLITKDGSFIALVQGEWTIYASAGGISGEASVLVTAIEPSEGGDEGSDDSPRVLLSLALLLVAAGAVMLLYLKRRTLGRDTGGDGGSVEPEVEHPR